MKKGMLILLSVFGLLMSGCTETTKTSVTVSFDPNNGKGSMEQIVVENGSEVTLPANTFTCDGHTFKGWNDAKDGNGEAYADGAKVKPTADMTLFAQWEVLKVDITFNNNPPTGSGAAVSETKQTVAVGQEVALEAPDVTIEGYTLLGWAKDKTATRNEYSKGSTITVAEAITLYAVWQKNEAAKVSIIFDGNGADGGSVMTPQVADANSTVALNINTFTKTGYTFSGWATAENATEKEYDDRAVITVATENLTLYAVWQAEFLPQQIFDIENTGENADGIYTDSVVTLPFTKVGEWTWPTDSDVTVTVTNDENVINSENVALNTESDNIVISNQTLVVGNVYTYSVTFSADGYQNKILSWTVTVADTRPVIEGVTVTLTPSDQLISGETVTVALTGTDTSEVSIENTVQVTGGESAGLTLSGSAFTVPTVSETTQLTFQFTLTKADHQNAIGTIFVTVYPEGHIRYDGKIFSLAKGFDFTQTAEVPGTKVATSDNYNNRTVITGAEDGYHFNNGNDTRIYLELQGVSFDLMTVNLKWANSGQPNFVFHGDDKGVYGYQFYKASNGNKGWFLNGDWFDSTGNSVTYNPAPAADTYHTFRVFDRGDGNRSSQLNDGAIAGYSFTNSRTLSAYTATRYNGNGMFLQFGNDNGNRNFTVRSINFYSEVSE